MGDSVSIVGECLYDCLFVFFNIVEVVSAAEAVAVLATEHLFLEALAVEFEAA